MVKLFGLAVCVCCTGRGFPGGSLSARAGENGPDWVPETVFAPVLGEDLKQGYTLRADTWDGSLPVGETRPIRHQFLKGNDYHFYVSTRVAGASASLHVYDQDGNLAEARAWTKAGAVGCFSGVEFRPNATATYYLVLKMDKSPEAKTAWTMAYAFK